MTKFKAQNKIKITNDKTKVLTFVICHLNLFLNFGL